MFSFWILKQNFILDFKFKRKTNHIKMVKKLLLKIKKNFNYYNYLSQNIQNNKLKVRINFYYKKFFFYNNTAGILSFWKMTKLMRVINNLKSLLSINEYNPKFLKWQRPEKIYSNLFFYGVIQIKFQVRIWIKNRKIATKFPNFFLFLKTICLFLFQSLPLNF